MTDFEHLSLDIERFAKVASDLGKLHREGRVDDETYVAKMLQIGAAVIRDEDTAQPNDPDQIDEETTADFYKRNPKRTR
jgi:hypothetical protein